MWFETTFLYYKWWHLGCMRNDVTQVDIHIGSEGRKAPGARISMESGANYFG